VGKNHETFRWKNREQNDCHEQHQGHLVVVVRVISPHDVHLYDVERRGRATPSQLVLSLQLREE
jgi:hypothetical protein